MEVQAMVGFFIALGAIAVMGIVGLSIVWSLGSKAEREARAKSGGE
jgi:hypothetical protein